MGVFKEHAHAFENVARKQAQIWNDACDAGYAYNTNYPPHLIDDLLMFVNDLKGTSLVRKREEDRSLGWVRLTIRIGWEVDEGMECGTEYVIASQNITNRMKNGLIVKDANRFISVDIKNYREPYKNR
jgi:hypothetical protein